jgi:hypothetical protein
MRLMRALQPMTGALEVYHIRRPSFRPSPTSESGAKKAFIFGLFFVTY